MDILELIRIKLRNNEDIKEIEKLLVDIDFNVEDITYKSKCRSLLEYSILSARYAFETLIKYIDVDIQGTDGHTVLMSIILLDSGGESDIISDDTYESYSMYILFVLDYVKNINIMDTNNNDTALHLYLKKCNRNKYGYGNIKLNVIKKMLELGFNISQKNYNRVTVILYAILANNADLVKLILNYHVGHINASLLLSAINSGASYDVIELLLPYIDDINKLQSTSRTILQDINMYSEKIDQEIIELLIENGAF